MKKFFLMAAMVLSSVGAFAQYSAGDVTIQPKVGLSCSSTTADGADFKAGFVGGVEAEYHVSPLFGLSVGALYSMQGAKVKDADEESKLNYINVPILANFYVANGLALKAGIQPGFKTSAKLKTNGIEVDYDKLGIEIRSVDFSIPVGISYEYSNFCLDARYNFGVNDIVKDGKKNSVFQLTLGYKFKL